MCVSAQMHFIREAKIPPHVKGHSCEGMTIVAGFDALCDGGQENLEDVSGQKTENSQSDDSHCAYLRI